MSRPTIYRQVARIKRQPNLHIRVRTLLKRAPMMAIPAQIRVWCDPKMPEDWSPIPETIR